MRAARAAAAPRILSIVIGQTNSSGSSSESSPNDSRRACRSASPLISRSRFCACSMTAASTCTAVACFIARSSAATQVPPSAACSRADAHSRSFSRRTAQEEQSVLVRATSRSTAVVLVPEARLSSAAAALPAAADSGPPGLSSATSGRTAPASMIAVLFASLLHARLLSTVATLPASCSVLYLSSKSESEPQSHSATSAGRTLSSATRGGMSPAPMIVACLSSSRSRFRARLRSAASTWTLSCTAVASVIACCSAAMSEPFAAACIRFDAHDPSV
eukprot:scaffold134575_cov63-Phaeocystis_antarctica.AAC.2